MKILGIGVDIVKNRRFQPLIRNQKFIKRTFVSSDHIKILNHFNL